MNTDTTTTTTNGAGDSTDDTTLDLKELLATLASFARSAQSLLPNTSNDSDNDDDEFAYQSSFPEFQTALRQAQQALVAVLKTGSSANSIEQNEDLEEDEEDWNTDLENETLWEECADACEELVEQVEIYLQEQQQDGDTSTTNILTEFTTSVRKHTGLQAIAAATHHDLPKPQEAWACYSSFILQTINARTVPFVPRLAEKPFAITPLNLTALVEGHGYDSRFGELRSSRNNKDNTNSTNKRMIAPTHHFPHPYATEIQSFQYTPTQLQVLSTTELPPKQQDQDQEELSAEWIDTEEQLAALAEELATNNGIDTLAVDLEAHSHRSFAGIVCLMQISFRISSENNNNKIQNKNFLIDTLALHECIGRHLRSVFANPAVCKVLHGADMDVQWLQRDFGIYIVNLFDTGRAARVLHDVHKSASYAHLLQHYCGVTADKSHQLADWRVRPLPHALQQYAIADTHYLLDIYEHIKYDLQQQQQADTSAIEEVLNISRQVSLIRYCPEPFFIDGYQKLLQSRRRGRSNVTHQVSAPAVLKALWDWRDATARRHDESCQYVCSNRHLLRMALAVPGTTTQLQSLFTTSTPPPLVLRYSQDILQLVKRALQEEDEGNNDDEEEEEEELADNHERQDDDDEEDDEEDEEVKAAPSSAFFKPANTDQPQPRKSRRGRTIMSPVLGTEALYEQAGWMTPLEQQQHHHSGEAEGEDDEGGEVVELVATTTDDDDDNDNEEEESAKPKKLLSVHASNQDYKSNAYSEHSLELGISAKSSDSRARSADGMGSVRAAASEQQLNIDSARNTAARIKSDMISSQQKTIPVVLGLVAPKGRADESENAKREGKNGDPKESRDTNVDQENTEEEEFIIPRSIREIYMISNRNRRNKKAGSPTPERGVTPTSEKEQEELARAEAVLKERGDAVAGYFDDSIAASPGKRPRTRSGRESEESLPADPAVHVASKDDDLAFMKDIGWIQNKEEVDGLLNQRYGGRNRGGDATGRAGSAVVVDAAAAAEEPTTGDEDAAAAGVGVIHPSQQTSNNPFFTGAALQGGPLTQQQQGPSKQEQQRPRKNSSGKGKQSRNRQERPEKKDGRTHSYRKR